jgi:hypothetical protein
VGAGPGDLAARRRDGEYFTSVLEGPRMWLIGDEASLAALA